MAKTKVFGWVDDTILNKNLFVEVSLAKNKRGYVGSNPEAIPDSAKYKELNSLYDVVVRAKIVSYSVSSSSTWESALEGKSADSSFANTSALLQTGTVESLFSENTNLAGRTLVGLESSIQVWRGEEPLQISMTIEFVAQQNAFLEVELPIQYLYRFKAPELKKGLVLGALTKLVKGFSGASKKDASSLGRIPFDINIDFMNKRFNSMYVLESISEDVDGIRIVKDGHRVSQLVSLSFKSKRAMINNGTDIKIT